MRIQATNFPHASPSALDLFLSFCVGGGLVVVNCCWLEGDRTGKLTLIVSAEIIKPLKI
jgi:hypothetical protein